MKNVTTFTNQGQIYLDNLDYESGLKQFDEALKLDPQHVDSKLGKCQAFYGLGALAYNKQDYHKALKFFNSFLLIHPGVYLAVNNLTNFWRTAIFSKKAQIIYVIGERRSRKHSAY